MLILDLLSMPFHFVVVFTLGYDFLFKLAREHCVRCICFFENILDLLGTIQVLRHQRGGWVGSENGNF
jgi:hypothetical protein